MIEYKDRSKRQASLNLIAQEIERTADEVSKKLHNLRSQMLREIKKQKTTKSGQAAVNKSKWEYFDVLKFTEVAVTANKTYSNMVNTKSVNKYFKCD